jgi:uncharacterized membrane-anchored protein YitT (DUF2179 family)
MRTLKLRSLTMGAPWNLFLLTLGGTVLGIAMKGVIIAHGFVSGGIYGAGILLFYAGAGLSPAIWYAIFNAVTVAVGWRLISRRFILYSLYGMGVVTISSQYSPWIAPIHDTMLAAIVGGCLSGAGMSIMLRSFGSDGGITIIAIILNQRYDIKLGFFNLVFNVVLFCLSLLIMEVDEVLYSMVMVFVQSSLLDYSMRVVNQRKLVFIISTHADEIANDIMYVLHRGCTFLPSWGAYTNQERKLIMTVVHNFQLKRLEALAYQKDPAAFLIIESTYNVLGQGFSSRHTY